MSLCLLFHVATIGESAENLSSKNPEFQEGNAMYYLTVALLMFVLPIVSILVELFAFRSSHALTLVLGKWFVFWAVGGRLLLTGLRQAIQPRFTAETILGIKGESPLQVVQELGFANISIGVIGIVSIFNGAWLMPAAIVGGLFYGCAGIRHVLKGNRNPLENTAMVSDLFIFAVMLVDIIFMLVSPSR
jgi:hypothetical protein